MKKFAVFVLAFAISASTYSVVAQQAGKVYRIGFLTPKRSIPHPVFLDGLRALGYVEGRNLVIEHRSGEGRVGRLPALAAELAALKVDVIVTHSTPGVRAAKKATRTIPIVMGPVGNAVRSGLVESLSRPGGNVTGSSFFGAELNGKRVEILKETLPSMSRLAIIEHPSVKYLDNRDTDSTAQSLGLEVRHYFARTPGDYERVFAAMKRQGAEAVLMRASPIFSNNPRAFIEVAARYRLPVIYPWRKFAVGGGLIAFGPDLAEMWRRAATFVDRILRGANPEDMPVERPTKFKLIVNLKTAKALGIAIPRSILLRATEVIE